jgi:hypothetical protein
VIGDRLHFFNGDQYASFDMKTGKTLAGYPKKTADGWPGLVFGRAGGDDEEAGTRALVKPRSAMVTEEAYYRAFAFPGNTDKN